MAWITASDVRAAIAFPSEGAPVSDTNIATFILDAQDEIEKLYKTKFGYVEDSGTATSGGTASLTDTGKDWSSQDYSGKVLWVYGGTGSGQYREIVSNTTASVTVSPDFTTNPSSDSTYRITDLGYVEETVDGSGTDTQFTNYFPLQSLNSLVVDDVNAGTAGVYTYSSGKVVLFSNTANVATFLNTEPQQIDWKYVYGVYPIPRIIKRLCTILAGIRSLAAYVGGSYSDYATVSLPGGISGSRGVPYVNLQAGIRELQKEADEIINKMYPPFVRFA